jgi:hypothetical protein
MPAWTPGRPDSSEIAPYAQAYVDLVAGADIIEILQTQSQEIQSMLGDAGEELANSAYAPGKWTVKQVIGHLSDTERIFSYRLLCLARRDRTPFPGFEQADYAEVSNAAHRSVSDLLDELLVVRTCTLKLLQSLSADAWMNRGTVSNHSITVRGIAFTTAGHERHHLNILSSRYLSDAAGVGA